MSNIQANPGMPKTAQGSVVVEIPGHANAALQRWIIGNTQEAAGYIPGVSPYVESNALLNRSNPTYKPESVVPTARCANGDLACISGVGAQQSSVPELTRAAREGIAETAASTSRQAGVIAAGATAVAAGASPPIKQLAGSVAVGATVVSVAADTVEQVVRPDTGQVVTGSGVLTLQSLAEKTSVGRIVTPITNEILEAWKASGSALAVEDWINNRLRK